VLKMHSQIGVDDCSTDLTLRGLPVFRGLIGPMPDGKGIVRYESPEVFETLTKEWGAPPPKRKRIRKKATAQPAEATVTAETAATATVEATEPVSAS
jgi:hypothetical protein